MGTLSDVFRDALKSVYDPAILSFAVELAMNLVESLLGYRSFSSESEIRHSIEQSRYYDSSKESPDNAGSLLIFETPRQHTWLVATGERLCFILDDMRKPAPRIARSVRRSELKVQSDGTIFLRPRTAVRSAIETPTMQTWVSRMSSKTVHVCGGAGGYTRVSEPGSRDTSHPRQIQ